MSHPKITFSISAKKDFETLIAFTNDAQFDDGRNLNLAIFKKFPQLKKYFYKNLTIKNASSLRLFINKMYENKKDEMKQDMKKSQKQWLKINSTFFTLVDKLFQKRKWPKGKYIAFSTIWGMYPRFLEDKTFQIPLKHKDIKYIPVIIAHELLHFMFYDYFYEHYPQYQKDQHNFFVWNISEIFNSIIQNSPLWLETFKTKSLAYPEHKEIITDLSKNIYKKEILDVDKITKNIIQKVKENFTFD